MADRFNADDYIDVASRIQEFYAKHPDGRLVTRSWQIIQTASREFVVAEAEAYRTPDDPHPGVGTAWEPIPGPTAFTRDSELQNAETSAWGRAIVSLGFATKNIASREEVRNRQYDEPPAARTRRQQPQGTPQAPSAEPSPTGLIEAELRERNITLSAVERVMGYTPANAEDAREWWTNNAATRLATMAAEAEVPAIEMARDIIARAKRPAEAQP